MSFMPEPLERWRDDEFRFKQNRRKPNLAALIHAKSETTRTICYGCGWTYSAAHSGTNVMMMIYSPSYIGSNDYNKKRALTQLSACTAQRVRDHQPRVVSRYAKTEYTTQNQWHCSNELTNWTFFECQTMDASISNTKKCSELAWSFYFTSAPHDSGQRYSNVCCSNIHTN